MTSPRLTKIEISTQEINTKVDKVQSIDRSFQEIKSLETLNCQSMICDSFLLEVARIAIMTLNITI